MSKRRSFVPALVALAVIAVVGVAAWAAWPALMQGVPDEKAAPDVVVGEVDDRPAPGSGETSEPEADQTPSEPTLDERVAEAVSGMTLEEKVAQLFVVRPEDLTHVGTQVAAGEATRAALEEYPVGGICYFAQNLVDPEQTREMLSNTQAYYEEITGLPCFLAVDEEGGTVLRVGSNPAFGVERIGNMCEVSSDDEAREVAVTIGSYLTDLGFNVDFAPDADIADVEGSTLDLRSFGASAEVVAPRVRAQVEGFLSTEILCSAKHFPGIGGAVGDSHDGTIMANTTMEELRASELVPFKAAMDAGVPFVMVGHITLPNVTGDYVPASLNPAIVQAILRDELGYDGIVITDSLSMGAVVEEVGYDRIGVQALLAGVDMVLMPADLEAAYQGIIDAVASGELSEERIDESVTRIVRTKLELVG